MIDLTKDQIVEPSVEAWFWDRDKECAINLKLRVIDHTTGYPYKAIKRRGYSSYLCCSLTNPNKPNVKKWKTVTDVPAELWGNALVKAKNDPGYYAVILTPVEITDNFGNINHTMHYLPLGQPLDGEWLEFESEVME